MLYLTFTLFVTVGKKIATVAVAWVTMKLALMPPSFLLLPLFFLLSSEKSSAVAELCRTRGIFLEPEEFAAETCAFCYHYVPMPKFKTVAHKWIIAPKNITQIKQGVKLTNGTHQVHCFFIKLSTSSFSLLQKTLMYQYFIHIIHVKYALQ